MPRSTLLLLLLCACVSRTADDDIGEAGDDDPTAATETEPGLTETSNASADGTNGTSGPSTTSATTSATTATVTTATATTDDPPPTIGFDADIQPIFDEHCVTACHEPGGQWGAFLDLSPGTAYAAIVGVPSPQFMELSHIQPGDPNASYLWHKINGTQVQIGGSGITMPSARPGEEPTVIRPEQFATLEAWILQGAPP